jgi:hypothetical protein
MNIDFDMISAAIPALVNDGLVNSESFSNLDQMIYKSLWYSNFTCQ